MITRTKAKELSPSIDMKITLSRSQWEQAGLKAGWIKKAEAEIQDDSLIILPVNKEKINKEILDLEGSSPTGSARTEGYRQKPNVSSLADAYRQKRKSAIEWRKLALDVGADFFANAFLAPAYGSRKGLEKGVIFFDSNKNPLFVVTKNGSRISKFSQLMEDGQTRFEEYKVKL